MGNKTFKKTENGNCDKYSLAPVITLEEILRDAVKRKAKYAIQFADYSSDTWTVAVELTQNRMDKLLDDSSVRKFRIEYDN